MTRQSWLTRVSSAIAPQWTMRRVRARLATEMLMRHYEAASVGRRTQGWHRSIGDANTSVGPYVGRLRDAARDLVRNNPYAASALDTIADHTVGLGIVGKPLPKNKRAADVWNAWANTTACDADGRNDFAGLQKLVMRTVAESGEVLVRRRLRKPEDGLPIPLQIQVLEPDYLDTSKHDPNNRVIYGVEFDGIGKPRAYWLFPSHPGSGLAESSVAVPAEGVRHIFRSTRAGQVRAASWFAPVLVKMKDFDEFEDATLMKQKIAACLAVITSDVDGSAPALGTADDSKTPGIDTLEPGMIMNMPPGRSVEVVQPPAVREYADYVKVTLRAIATGLGVTYEDMTGDYTGLPFSAARMSRLRHWARVDDWRWRLLVPQFCDPVWGWAMQAAGVMGVVTDAPRAHWTAAPMPMLEPDKEGIAYQRNIRTGIMTLSEAIRERGYDPEELLAEMAADNKRLDELELVLDSDARKMTQAGQAQGSAKPEEKKSADEPPPSAAADDDAAAADDDEGDDD